MMNPLQSLIDLRQTHTVKITLTDAHRHLKSARLHVGDLSWPILVDDEYGDLHEDHQLMALFLVLRELEVYESEPDFLKWCMQNGSDPADHELLVYYRGLGRSIVEISGILGAIDSHISSMDYQLRTGVIHQLIEAG